VDPLDFNSTGAVQTLPFKDIMIKKIEATTSDSNESHVIVLFNGKTLKGWKALDNKKTDGWGVKKWRVNSRSPQRYTFACV